MGTTNRINRLYASLLLLGLFIASTKGSDTGDIKDSCYDKYNNPRKCSPEFINVAFNRTVIATNTCGTKENQTYCEQIFQNTVGLNNTCHICDQRVASYSHPAKYLTDNNNVSDPTWWQSETMELGVQYPNSVNLTINFGKSFIITYVQLRFRSPRPESFAIYKRTHHDDKEWQPYQYYSASCNATYGLITDGILKEDVNETAALCTAEYSDITPLTDGNVAFSTLESRPNAYRFDDSPALKEWVTATDLLISLNRINTYGDEAFNDEKVLRSYFYAITDLAIGGYCNCNGHASECVEETEEDLDSKLVCKCEHNTAGVDCEKCLPLYNNKPWSAANSNGTHACESINI